MWKVNIPNGNVYVAENTKGKIVGFACGGKERSGEFAGYDGELYAIYILEKYQGQGIGRKLTEAVKHHLREIGLTSMVILVLEGNKAYQFYEALGGKKIGILEDTIADKVVNELVYGWAEI
ncbi:GNAT family N-acetyltransferase [Niallia taxi]